MDNTKSVKDVPICTNRIRQLSNLEYVVLTDQIQFSTTIRRYQSHYKF